VPPEIALTSEINISMTPRGTRIVADATEPNMPISPHPSPTRIPAPNFGATSPPRPGQSGVFAPPVLVKDDPDTPSTPIIPSSSTRPRGAGHRSVNTFGQHDILDIPHVFNNVRELDENLPHPIYPSVAGQQPLDRPLPMIAEYPRAYYVIFKGLRIGVFYDIW
jgi:hypothetical protein